MFPPGAERLASRASRVALAHRMWDWQQHWTSTSHRKVFIAVTIMAAPQLAASQCAGLGGQGPQGDV